MPNYKNFMLSPIKPSDKDRILAWRNSDRIRVNMYNDHLITQAEHEAWFQVALTDDSSQFHIFSYEGRPIGFVSFTNISHRHGRCSWAYYLGETDVPRGCGAAMEFFALDHVFSTMKVRKLCCEVFTFNAGVIRLHEKFGFSHEGKLVAHYKKNDQYEDIVCLARFGETWATEREALMSRVFQRDAG